MKNYSSKVLLEHLHQQTERQITKAVREWQNSQPFLLLAKPAANSWSAAECLEHLNIYGRYYLSAIEKEIGRAKLKNSQPASQFSSGWLGNYFTNLMQPSPNGHLKMKMKAVSSAIPPADLDARKVVAEFIDQMEKLQLLMRMAESVNINNVRVPISIAKFIRLKLGDVFSFLIAHIDRHMMQAERAYQQAGHPQKASLSVQ